MVRSLPKWVFLVVLGCLAVLAPPAAVGGGGGGSRIVFVERDCYSSRHCHSRVAVIDADGSGLRFLTPLNVHVASPRWSPDRSKIAYIRTGSWPPQVWLMAADGTHQRPLTRLPQGVLSVGLPSLDWSPNGRQIVLAAYPSRAGGASQLYLANVRTGTTKLLLQEAIGTYSGDDDPVWSPDGRWIAFVRHGRSCTRPDLSAFDRDRRREPAHAGTRPTHPESQVGPPIVGRSPSPGIADI